MTGEKTGEYDARPVWQRKLTELTQAKKSERGIKGTIDH